LNSDDDWTDAMAAELARIGAAAKIRTRRRHRPAHFRVRIRCSHFSARAGRRESGSRPRPGFTTPFAASTA
jgi:hypothetical protein